MRNFGDFPDSLTDYRNSKVVILPVPYDGTSTWLKGANKGPEAILEASPNLEFYDFDTHREVYKHTGIHTATPVLECSSPELMTDAVYERVSELIRDYKFVIVLGGEHSVSIGTAKAHHENYENMSVLQIDAHGDMRDEYENSKYNHACVMARIKEFAPCVQAGIRSLCTEELHNIDYSKMFFAEEMMKNNRWIVEIIRNLTPNVYITVDLDAFDPSIISSTGTPEPGGLNWYQVIDLMKAVFNAKNVVGFDVVELCPNPYNKVSDFIAAKLVYKMIDLKY
ncbi:MAG: agmatinase [Bacteroidota bacterium]